MSIKEDFENLLDKLQTERDEINLKMHLASMEARQEFEEAEKKWGRLKAIATEPVEASEELISDAKIIGKELKETYSRISKRLGR